MKLTKELKEKIDNMSYESMLRQWRFTIFSTPIFQEESGDYFLKIMLEKKKSVDYVQISKNVGWDR